MIFCHTIRGEYGGGISLNTLEQILSGTDPKEYRKLIIQYIIEHPNEQEIIIDTVQKISQKVDLFEEDKSSPIETNPTSWTEDYYRFLKKSMEENFSKKKFFHMLDVATYINQPKSELLSKNSNEKIRLYGNTMGFIMIGGVVLFLTVVIFIVIYFKNKYA